MKGRRVVREDDHTASGLTSNNQVDIREGILCLHQSSGVPLMKHVEDAICVHPNWFCVVGVAMHEEESSNGEMHGHTFCTHPGFF